MNEDTQSSAWLPAIDLLSCTGCGDCVVACPAEVLSLINGKAAVTTPEQCNYCGACETVCPVNAIFLPYQIVLDVR